MSNIERPPTPFAFRENLPERTAASFTPLTSDVPDETRPDPVVKEEETDVPPPDYEDCAQSLISLGNGKLSAPSEEWREEGQVSNFDDKGTSCATGMSSPADTECVEEWLLPRSRRLPHAPVDLRPSHYQEACDDFVDEQTCLSKAEAQHFPCFRPHMIALMRDRVLYPFVETNRPGPVTDTSVPIQDRTYYPNADFDIHYNILRVGKLIMVDLRSMTQASTKSFLPQGQTGVFSVLAPRNAPCDLVYPGLIWPNQFGPLDLPPITARTWGQRYKSLRKLRESITNFISRIRSSLTTWQIEEAESPLISLYAMHNRQLTEKQVSRAMFFRVIHPTFNPLVTHSEAVFLRGACYILRKFQHTSVATAIDNLLRSPQLDTHVCQKMLARGWLDRDGVEDEAFRFLESYEDLAQGDNFADEGEEVY
jgi:hypothetical protein